MKKLNIQKRIYGWNAWKDERLLLWNENPPTVTAIKSCLEISYLFFRSQEKHSPTLHETALVRLQAEKKSFSSCSLAPHKLACRRDHVNMVWDC